MSDHRPGCYWYGHELRHVMRPDVYCCKDPNWIAPNALRKDSDE